MHCSFKKVLNKEVAQNSMTIHTSSLLLSFTFWIFAGADSHSKLPLLFFLAVELFRDRFRELKLVEDIVLDQE